MKNSPPLKKTLPVWFKIGCLGFGGPSGQITLLHTEIVEKRGWVGEADFVRALQFCMLLPGPEAQQLATYLGWRLHGVAGGVTAGVFFFLPAMILLWGLSFFYVTGQHWPLLMAFFAGLKPAVVAIIFSACWRIGKRTVTSGRLALLAVTALLLLSFTQLSYPLVVLAFGILGAVFLNQGPPVEIAAEVPFCLKKIFLTAFSIILLWVIPIGMLLLWLGSKSLPVRVGLFFAKVAVVSFGGAYAALSYVSLHAVRDWGWLTYGQMMDGLGLAETTPGPLLIALQFVAFLAAYKTPGILSPLAAATLASLTACWSLFLPSFLWIFTFAPQMDRLASHPRIASALSAVGAVVTAVIVHLTLWFAGSLFFPKNHLTPIAWMPLLMTVGVFFLLQGKRLSMITLILLSGIIGVLIKCF